MSVPQHQSTTQVWNRPSAVRHRSQDRRGAVGCWGGLRTLGKSHHSYGQHARNPPAPDTVSQLWRVHAPIARGRRRCRGVLGVDRRDDGKTKIWPLPGPSDVKSHQDRTNQTSRSRRTEAHGPRMGTLPRSHHVIVRSFARRGSSPGVFPTRVEIVMASPRKLIVHPAPDRSRPLPVFPVAPYRCQAVLWSHGPVMP